MEHIPCGGGINQGADTSLHGEMDWLDAERGHSPDSVLTAHPAASEQAGQSRVVVTVSIDSCGK